MQNYDYLDILDFKDRSDRDRIAIQPQDRDPLIFGSRSDLKIAIRFISDRDLYFGAGSRSEKNLDRDPIENSNTIFNLYTVTAYFQDHGLKARFWV